VKSRPVENPPVRFRDVTVTYEDGDGPPPAKVTLLEDQSRSILSRNDSPDLNFRWSANPYRGCLHACAYCVSGDSRILMADSRTRRMRDLKAGDEVIGTRVDGTNRYYVRTTVLDHWATLRIAYRVQLADGTEIVCSGDHRFLTERGWKYVMPIERPSQRPFLTFSNSLLGVGAFAEGPEESPEYRAGYLCGMIRGDGLLRAYDYSGRRRATDVQYQFRLALVDLEGLQRTKRYLEELAIETPEIEFQAAAVGSQAVRAIRTHARTHVERIERAIEFPAAPCREWRKGFLAGIFDAEGSRSCGVFRISNSDARLLDTTLESLRLSGFDAVLEAPRDNGANKPVSNVRLRGGLREHLRFFHTTNPAISRKWNLDGVGIKTSADLRVVSIERIGLQQLFDITTGTGDYIANGVVSHNCYARPNHEYLDMGAGTDFDTKIVFKPRAAELLREAFEKPSWKGELVMFSGVTDCYQAVEKELQLTKQCLEVCLEYRNPVSIITKSALVERDVDLLAELAREAGLSLNVSLAWIDAELARTIEPWAAAPQRRLKVIETFAKAGVPVGIMMAPIIPGLNDNQIVKLLEAAHEHGAQWAGWSLLRLPGAVKEVFEDRLRVSLPLVADRVMNRVRETRGGDKLYDATFGVRGRGVGVYAQTIASLFDTTVRRLGFHDKDEPDPPSRFRRPPKPTNQLSLF
jgi:DNA repair photolyase